MGSSRSRTPSARRRADHAESSDRPDPHVHRAELERPARRHHARSNVDGVLRWARRTSRTQPVRPPRSRAVPLLGAAQRCSPKRRLPCDVGLVQVSAPDEDGRARWGSVSTMSPMHCSTPRYSSPKSTEDAGHHRYPADTARSIRGDHRHRSPTARGQRSPAGRHRGTGIATHVAELIDDGDTVQLGVGSLGAAVLDALAGHEDLGFHTGMITDGVLRLIDKGVATTAKRDRPRADRRRDGAGFRRAVPPSARTCPRGSYRPATPIAHRYFRSCARWCR